MKNKTERLAGEKPVLDKNQADSVSDYKSNEALRTNGGTPVHKPGQFNFTPRKPLERAIRTSGTGSR